VVSGHSLWSRIGWDKEDILIELGNVWSDQSIPVLISGDFNLLIFSFD
jgi:hypothetical protein